MHEYAKKFFFHSDSGTGGGGGWRNKVKEKLHGPLPPFFFGMQGYASQAARLQRCGCSSSGADVDDHHQSFIIIIIVMIINKAVRKR